MNVPHNLSATERAVSGALGAAISLATLRRAHPLLRAAAAVVGLGLLARAVAGHCAVKASLSGGKSLRDGIKDQWRATRDLGPGRARDSGAAAIDQAVEDSFPASDPPSSHLPDEPPSNADDKWEAARAAGTQTS